MNALHPVRSWRALAVAAVVLAAGGCGTGIDASSSTDPSEPTTTETASAVTTTADERPGAASGKTIVVTATGTASGTPDAVTLTLAVEVTAPSTAEVLASVGDRSTALQDYLVAQGVAAADLQTTQLSVYPVYGNYDASGMGTVTGYAASVAMNVTLHDLTQASAVVDGAAATVGDSLRVYGMSWSLRDRDRLEAAARADGVQAAREQAAQLADAAGLTLGEIVALHAEPSPTYGVYGEGDGSSIPFAGGTASVQVTVEVTFSAG